MSAPLPLPPQDIEAERCVLGSLLLDNQRLDEVAALVADEDFYRRSHGLVFSAIAALRSRGEPADTVTLYAHLKAAGELDQVGGPEYLAKLAEVVPTPVNAAHYARIVRDRSVLRRYIAESSLLLDEAKRDQVGDLAEFLGKASSQLAALQDAKSSDGPAHVREHLKGVICGLEQAARPEEERDTHNAPLPTGFPDLDELLGGLSPTDLVVLAARPSMGKTALAMNLAVGAARRKVTTVVFSLEMSAEQLVLRSLAADSGVRSEAMKKGKLTEEHWDSLFLAADTLSMSPLWIDDTPSLRITELRARCRRLQQQHGLGLVVVDYLQLMRGPAGLPSREQEVAEISRSLKALAKELQLPVVALSQLNRELEKRKNRRPILADLRESGAIEQDADVVMFVYRDEVYNPASKEAGIAEIIVGKHRNGAIGTVKLAFRPELTKFASLARSW